MLDMTSGYQGEGVPPQDIEGDCTRLLETGLFARVRPRTQLPIGTQGPGFIRDRDGHLNPVVPLNQVGTLPQYYWEDRRTVPLNQVGMLPQCKWEDRCPAVAWKTACAAAKGAHEHTYGRICACKRYRR